MKTFNLRLLALFLFVIFTWGLSWPVSKIGLDYMSPIWYVAARLLMGTITMVLIVIPVGKFSIPQTKDYPLIAVIGFLQISIYILLASTGLKYLPAGRSALFAYLTPLWVMPIAVFIFHEKTGFWRWLGFFLGVSGLLILLSPWQMNWSDTDTLIGTAMLLLASLSWAISMLYVRYMEWTKSPLELIPWQLLVATLPILLFAWFKEPLHFVWSPILILSLLYTGIIVTGISYWLGVIVNKELPTIIVSLGFLLVPVVSLVISAIYMQEVINIQTTFAIVLIILGLASVVV